MLPVAAGGGTDALARMIGQGLLERWGKQVVVENRPGAGTTIALLHKESTATLCQPENVSRLANDGAEVVANTPEAFDAFIRAESVKWAQVAKAAGIKPE